MKLLLLSFGPISGVREKGNIGMLKQHNPRGVFEEVHVVEPPSLDKGVEKLWDDFVIYHTHVPKVRGWSGKFLLALGFLFAFLKALRISKTEGVNLIRAQGPFESGVLGVLLHKLTGIPLIVSLHGDYDMRQRIEGRNAVLDNEILSEFIERFSISNASKVFVLTPYLKKYANRHGAEEKNIFIVPHKVDPTLFQKKEKEKKETRKNLGVDRDEILLVFVGRLTWQKDPLTLLKAYSIAKPDLPKLKLVIIGDGPLREEMEKFIVEKNLTDIILMGFIPRERVASIMAASDAFVLPTQFEGFGFVFIEAQASGLPILTTQIPHTEGIINEKNPLLFQPRDADGLAKKIKKLEDQELREELSKKSEKSVKKFDLEGLQKREAKIFRRIASQS